MLGYDTKLELVHEGDKSVFVQTLSEAGSGSRKHIFDLTNMIEFCCWLSVNLCIVFCSIFYHIEVGVGISKY